MLEIQVFNKLDKRLNKVVYVVTGTIRHPDACSAVAKKLKENVSKFYARSGFISQYTEDLLGVWEMKDSRSVKGDKQKCIIVERWQAIE